MEQVIVAMDVQRCYRRGLKALELLREWRSVLTTRLPGGTMEGLERDLMSLRPGTDRASGGSTEDSSKVVFSIETTIRRIQGAGLLYFRNQPGVANRFAALSMEET